jgi:hypothetical protein
VSNHCAVPCFERLAKISGETQKFLTGNFPTFEQIWDVVHMLPCSDVTVSRNLTKQSQCALRDPNQIVEPSIF